MGRCSAFLDCCIWQFIYVSRNVVVFSECFGWFSPFFPSPACVTCQGKVRWPKYSENTMKFLQSLITMSKEVFHSTWIVIMHHSSRGSVLCKSHYRPAFVIISFVWNVENMFRHCYIECGVLLYCTMMNTSWHSRYLFLECDLEHTVVSDHTCVRSSTRWTAARRTMKPSFPLVSSMPSETTQVRKTIQYNTKCCQFVNCPNDNILAIVSYWDYTCPRWMLCKHCLNCPCRSPVVCHVSLM